MTDPSDWVNGLVTVEKSDGTLRDPKDLNEAIKRWNDCFIIAQVTEPSDWVNGLVNVEKSDGTLRNPKDLYEAIKRPQNPTKTIEDIRS